MPRRIQAVVTLNIKTPYILVLRAMSFKAGLKIKNETSLVHKTKLMKCIKVAATHTEIARGVVKNNWWLSFSLSVVTSYY